MAELGCQPNDLEPGRPFPGNGGTYDALAEQMYKGLLQHVSFSLAPYVKRMVYGVYAPCWRRSGETTDCIARSIVTAALGHSRLPRDGGMRFEDLPVAAQRVVTGTLENWDVAKIRTTRFVVHWAATNCNVHQHEKILVVSAILVYTYTSIATSTCPWGQAAAAGEGSGMVAPCPSHRAGARASVARTTPPAPQWSVDGLCADGWGASVREAGAPTRPWRAPG
jgi:hypothetical protein